MCLKSARSPHTQTHTAQSSEKKMSVCWNLPLWEGPCTPSHKEGERGGLAPLPLMDL